MTAPTLPRPNTATPYGRYLLRRAVWQAARGDRNLYRRLMRAQLAARRPPAP